MKITQEHIMPWGDYIVVKSGSVDISYDDANGIATVTMRPLVRFPNPFPESAKVLIKNPISDGNFIVEVSASGNVSPSGRHVLSAKTEREFKVTSQKGYLVVYPRKLVTGEKPPVPPPSPPPDDETSMKSNVFVHIVAGLVLIAIVLFITLYVLKKYGVM